MAIYFAPVANLDDKDDEPIPLNRVDNPIVARSDPQQFHLAAEMLDARGPSVGSKGIDPGLDSLLVGPGNRFKLS